MDSFLTYRTKFLFWQKKKFSNERLKLLASINNVMNRLSESFEKNIINQYYYNFYLNKLEIIHNNYKKINKITYYNLRSTRVKINNIQNEIIDLSKKTGMMTVSSITSLNFCIDVKDIQISDKPTVEFVDLVFNPISYEIHEIKSTKQSNELVVYNAANSPIQKQASASTTDLSNITNLKSIMFTKLLKKNSLIESVYGSRIYILIKRQNFKTRHALIIDGYFKNDPLNISRYNGFIYEKQQQLLTQVEKLEIDTKFKNGFIDQISIRDILLYTSNELLLNIKTAYDLIQTYKKKNISQIVKDFLNKSIEEQRDLITYFLICDEENDFKYFAFLLYDMITNESYLLKAQPLADQIFNSIHWSIQKQFKNIIERVDDYTKKLMNVGEDMISYEKRICLMKAPDTVKSKAMEKLKEINNKNSENCSKAQQYLDSLLKVPFGTYRQEKILNTLDVFKDKITNTIIFGLNILNEIDNKKTDLKKFLEFLNSYKNFDWKYNNIEQFVYQSNEKLNSLLGINVPQSVSSISITCIYNKIKNYQVKDLKEIIDIIYPFVEEDKRFLLKKKQQKVKLVDGIIKCVNLDIIENISNNKESNEKLFQMISKLSIAHDDCSKLLENSDKLLVKTIKNEFSKLEIEWNKIKDSTYDYVNNIDTVLDKSIYGQNDAKKEVKRIIAQWINGEGNGYCLGFEGPPGTGKTSLAKYGIANSLKDEDGSNRPFSFIALGGSCNGSTLEGHNYTYVGSTYGKIAEILIDSKCMNPIIYIDELDKISNTDNGRELIGILTHITDSTQNDQFMDKYFSGIPLDLSKVLFIFSYNDYNLLDSILADRIHRVKFDYLKVPEKLHIMDNYLIPTMLQTIGFEQDSIKISREALMFIIKNYTYEAGVRKFKERIFEILRQINLECITNKKMKFTKYNEVDLSYVKEFFQDKPSMSFTKINSKPKIGLVNGLFATASGIGGITIIEAFKTPSDTKFSLLTTGQQGDVMKESITCAKTIAWNVLPEEKRNKIIKDIKDEKEQPFGIHIHCPEAATPKDGPSAGGAITLAMVSLLMGIPVNNEIAMTGEIDLNGSIHQIGGLDLKIDGGKWAGIKKILVPRENSEDLDIIKLKNPNILDDVEIVIIDNIWQIVEHGLVLSKPFKEYNFTNYS